VRLFDRVLIRVKTPKKPHQKCLCHVMRLMLLLPGRVTCRHVSRDSPYHENTFARGLARDVDCVSLNRAAMVEVVPPSHEPVLAVDPSCVPNSGTHTSGLDRCWNGAHSRAEKGWEMATRAWIAVTHRRASTLSVEQTSRAPSGRAEETRIDAYLAHMARVVTTPPVQALKYLAVDGYCSQKTCVDGLGALDVQVIGKLRRDAKLRPLDSGPRGDGPGRPNTSDGNVDVSDLSRLEPVDAGDADLALYAPGVTQPPCKRHLHVVVVRHLPTGRSARLFSTAVARSAKTLDRYDQARFQIEWLFRAANQFTGLSDGQARSAGKRRFQCKARLSAVSFAKLEARQRSARPQAPVSLARLKRRYFNHHLVDRIVDHVAAEGR